MIDEWEMAQLVASGASQAGGLMSHTKGSSSDPRIDAQAQGAVSFQALVPMISQVTWLGVDFHLKVDLRMSG